VPASRTGDCLDDRRDKINDLRLQIGSSVIRKIALTLSAGGWQSCTRGKSVGRLGRGAPPDPLPAHKILKLKMTTTPVIRNALSPSPLWRRVLFTVSAVALVGSAVALQPVAHAGTAGTPTPTPTRKFQLLATIPLESSLGNVTINRALNKIYTSGRPPADQDIEVIDGVTFAKAEVGIGHGPSVDNKTNRYWAASVDENSVIVRDGTTNEIIATVAIPGGVCPIRTNYDFFKNRVWTSAKCSGGNDPIFAIDARSFEIIAGTPIYSGGEVRGIISNGANGRVYFADREGDSLISKRVDPTTFAVTLNAFGTVKAINALTNKLYAVPYNSNVLQIIDGKPDPEVIVRTVPLLYHPGVLGVNTAFNYLYLANPDVQSIEVRNASTGAFITTFSLSENDLTPDGSMAVDSSRSRIYVIQESPPTLLVIEDLIATFGPDCILSH
jgi:DNA-binding beta-propeller fold protein YncE